MKKNSLDLNAYFERIAYQGRTVPDEATLTGLHKAHTLTIPFENLDVYYGRPISLDTESLFDKLVTRRRGGYCFEMNGLFCAVLERIGFRVTPLLARVAVDFTREFGPKTHQVLMVEISGTRWLADVGFGKDGIVTPLLLDEPSDQRQFGRTYRVSPHGAFGYILDLISEDRELCQYAFTLEPCGAADYMVANHFTATHPTSRFVTGRICTRPTAQGRISLTDRHLKIVCGRETRETAVTDESGFANCLARHFGSDLAQVHRQYRISNETRSSSS